jgi:hypothetical protein
MEEPLTQTWQMQLTPQEKEALESLAAVHNISPREALRNLFLSGLRMAMAVEADATDAGLAPNEAAQRILRAFLMQLPELPDPEVLRTVAGLFIREAEKMEEREHRQQVVRAMRALQDRICQRVGNIPDIEELIDEGRDDG